MLVDTYQSLDDADKALSAATRLLQVDPNNMKAIFLSVVIKKSHAREPTTRRPATMPRHWLKKA